MIGKLPLNKITIISSAKAIYQYCVTVVVYNLCLAPYTGKQFILVFFCTGLLRTMQIRCNHANCVCVCFTEIIAIA